MLVREIMTSPAVTVQASSTVKHAIQTLDRHRITAMPVTDDAGRLIGVISEADVLRDSVPPDRRSRETPLDVSSLPVHLTVGDVMTHLPLWVSPDDDVSQAVDLLVDTQVKSLPVVLHDRVVGVISRRDVIAVLARRDPLIEAEVDELLRSAGVECSVDVVDGVVRIADGDDPGALRIARAIAASVPGVIAVSTA